MPKKIKFESFIYLFLREIKNNLQLDDTIIDNFIFYQIKNNLVLIQNKIIENLSVDVDLSLFKFYSKNLEYIDHYEHNHSNIKKIYEKIEEFI